MTYEEFKREIKKLGLIYVYCKCGSHVLLMVFNELIATISICEQYQFDMNLNTSLSDDMTHKIIDLCCKLIKTPLYKRGEIK